MSLNDYAPGGWGYGKTLEAQKTEAIAKGEWIALKELQDSENGISPMEEMIYASLARDLQSEISAVGRTEIQGEFLPEPDQIDAFYMDYRPTPKPIEYSSKGDALDLFYGVERRKSFVSRLLESMGGDKAYSHLVSPALKYPDLVQFEQSRYPDYFVRADIP